MECGHVKLNRILRVAVERGNSGARGAAAGRSLRRRMPPVGTALADAFATPVCTRRGPLHRMFHHSAHTLQDKFIGYPETFVEPPLGLLRQRAIRGAGRQGRTASVHALPHAISCRARTCSRRSVRRGSTSCSARMPGWLGPIVVEWTPEQPRAGRVAPAGDPGHCCSRRASRSWPTAS